MRIEKYLLPVGPNTRAYNKKEQLGKILEEYREAHNALIYLENARIEGESAEVLIRLEKEAAMEVGDIIIACITLLSMMGVSFFNTMKSVFEKNDKRGYYR